MHHTFLALVAHPDVAKLELHDGVLDAASGLLAEESSRHAVVVEVGRESSLAERVGASPCSWGASMLISAAEAADIDVASIGSSLASVATVAASWEASVIEGRPLNATWVGITVPGSKLSFVLTAARGVDTASFESWLRNELTEAELADTDFGCRAITGQSESDLFAIVSFWFAKAGDLDRAVSSELFAAITSSPLIDPGSIQTFTAVEHRLTPNPNAWNMPTEPLMPVRVAASDEPS